MNFDEAEPIIEKMLETRRRKWTLYAISGFFDFNDVKSIIKTHIWKKFSQFDQTKPLENWVSVIINNQIRNLRRNMYDNYSRPCLKCAENQGDNLCAIFGKQNSECNIYAKWEKDKKGDYCIDKEKGAPDPLQWK